ncbi:uncharacterized protein LOC112093778 [Morus notabilis]|uniref:uncharacterized protein LOC112093778 n=1 Tax=Morus notabilis TaxID=981085 RepID=UPI000CED6DEF|nr:uncharacterized protein LOC112093778 [Morus notabilis]
MFEVLEDVAGINDDNEMLDETHVDLEDAQYDEFKDLLSELQLPSSHYESKKLMSKLGLGYETIHVWEYDCALFWKENADLQMCPLKHLFGSHHTAKDMTWHQRGHSNDEDLMRHPVDGNEWKEIDEKYHEFSRELRNVRLGLAVDGFNPFRNMRLLYSMWPVVLTTYNLPLWLCTKDPYKMLTLLISGPNAPGKDMDMWAMLLMVVNDFPTCSILSGWSGQGYLAWPTCNDSTSSKQITSKTCFVGHRQWLPIKNGVRKTKKFDGKVEKLPPPARKSVHQILAQLQNVSLRLPGKHEKYGGKKRKRHASELNWTKKSIFWELRYWKSLSLRHNLDVLHIEKNVCDSLLGTILDIDKKSKDTDKARIDLQHMGVLKELHLYKDGDRWMKPHASYTLSPNDVIHLPGEATRGGPVHLRWMYPFERFLGSLKKYVKNRACPEGSIAEAYIVNEALTFCSLYLTGVETRFNQLARNWVDDEDRTVKKISVFETRCRTIGKMTPITLDTNLREKAEWYVLQNCPKIQQFIE